MTTRRFVRPARMVQGPKSPPVTELKLEPPTELPKPMPTPKARLVMPVVMVAGMGGMMVMMFRGGTAPSPMSLMFPLMMLGSMAGMLGGGGGGRRGGVELDEDRKDYLRSLAEHRRQIHESELELYEYLSYSHPGPAELGRLVGKRRMWEVQAGHAQFLRVRIGIGRIANQVRVVVPEAAPIADLDPVGVVELTRFAKAYSTVGGMPVAMNLLSTPQISLDGDRVAMTALLRAIIAETVVLHGPDQVGVAAAVDDPDSPEWEWLKWLPHAQHETETDAIGSARLVYRSVGEMRAKLLTGLNRGPFSANAKPGQDRRHYLLVVALDEVSNERAISGIDGCTWLRLGPVGEPLPRSLSFTVSADRVLDEITTRGTRRVGVADTMTMGAAISLARAVSCYRLWSVVEAVHAEQSGGTSWPEMLGILDPGALHPARHWVARPDADRSRLNIPFGHDPAGGIVYLDIKESAEEGMGPHGMCIGATGSGKSEFLRTLVLSAVATHSSDVLNLLLVDFKGGATFLGFDRLAHVTAVVTNMEEEADLVTRMADVINGEVARRQRVLRDAGNFANVADYERAREQGASMEPLPTLLIVLDEFAELLEQYPDFAKLFVAIGRVGRSLRIHLLLSSQKVPANRMGELEAHLSYRIALRTNQTSDSRDAIGTADAYHLPKKPGSGYLRVGSGDLQRFQAAFVGGPYLAPLSSFGPGASQASRTPGGDYHAPQRFTATPLAVERQRAKLSAPAPTPDSPAAETVTVMETVLRQLAGHGRPAHRMWLPPLGVPATLERLVAAVSAGTLELPLAIVDKPSRQRQDVWSIDVSGAGGHVAIVGAPQSGKSTVLQTLVMAASLTHSPEQVQFYCLDFSGSALQALRGLPHVGSVAGARDDDRIRRTFALLTGLIAARQALFAELDIDTMREFRRRRNLPDEGRTLAARDRHGDVFLVIDGWDVAFNPTGRYFDEYMATMESIALQGLNYGVHLVLTSSRWGALRPAIKDMVASRIEMRLGDLTDTVFNMHRAVVAAVPVNRPGRCISSDGLHMLAALPRIDGDGNPDTAGQGLTAAIAHLKALYPGRRAPEVRLLPDRIALDRVRAHWPAATSLAERLIVPFGVRESDLSAAAIDFGVSTHMLVLGSAGSGKSVALATILESIRRQCDESEARVFLIDYRRRHMDAVPAEMLINHVTNERDLTRELPFVIDKMRSRRAPDGVTSRQLAERSWWSGPEVFIVIEDYHMVVQRGTLNPLEPLKDIIVDGRDTGLHLIAARNIAQASTALYDSVLGQMKNLNSSAIILDGDKNEGALVGDVRAGKQPPGRGYFVEPMYSRKDLVQISVPSDASP